MSRYIPTAHLRFVEREVQDSPTTARRVRFLQQGWAPEHGGGFIEWRDVPLQAPCNCTAHCSQCMPTNPITAGRTKESP